ncbi:MAG: enoyl-CoA hydratase-related protein [Pseudomonadota bacterium]
MQFSLIQVDVADDIATLTMNDPASRNGLTVTMQQEMLAALAQLALRDDVGALIVTGAGQSFCAGANLGQLDDNADSGATLGQRGARMMEKYANPLILALQELPFPVIAAVNGAAAGAGISLALAADITIAARSAFFIAPFLPRLGIVPDLGASWFLPRLAGRARTMGLVLLGERLPAETALQWGLIWECADDAMLLERARELARQLACAPAHSALEARRALAASERNDLAGQLDYEMERQRELLDRPTFQEGVNAFFEKREPRFTRPPRAGGN